MVRAAVSPVSFFCFQDGEDEEFKDLADEDEGEERFVDADKEDGAGAGPEGTKPAASWVHHQNLEGVSRRTHTPDFPLTHTAWELSLEFSA